MCLGRPAAEKLLEAASRDGTLDDPLSDVQLAKISRHILQWEARSCALGLSEVEIEDIKQDYRGGNEMQRIAMLRKWAKNYGDRATLRTLIDISIENNWTTFISKVGTSLGYIEDEKPGIPWMWMFLLRLLLILLLILLLVLFLLVVVMFPPTMRPKVSQSLPNQKKNFFGREKEVKHLLEIVDFSNDSFQFINIIGPPGFGKSALAVSVGNEMLKRRAEVYYIDLLDFPQKHFKQTLAEKILMEADYVDVTVTFDSLIRWGKRRWSNNIIILDNLDECIKNQKDNFQDAIEKLLLHFGSNFKIMTTSREVLFHSDTHFVHKIHPIDTKSACQVLEHRNPSLLSENEKQTIANLTGDVPLALQIVGALLSNKINSASEVIENLKKQPIPTLSPNELRSRMQLDASISLSYNSLDSNMQKVGRYLAYFSGSFDQYTALGVLQPLTFIHEFSQVHLSLKNLVQLSLIEFDEKSERFHFHKLIRDYFMTRTNWNEGLKFFFSLQTFYSDELCDMAETFQTSPKKALQKLDLDRHHVQQLMLTFILDTQSFDIKLSTCFLTAVKTKYLKCRFGLPEIINCLKLLTTSFENYIIPHLLKMTMIDITQEFDVYVKIVTELANLLEETGENEEALSLMEARLVLVDLICPYFPGTNESCRTFYGHLLTYEDKFDAETAKQYHIKFLENSKESQIDCKSTDVFDCDYAEIGVSYLKLKNFTQTKLFFEKALADEKTTYSLFDRMFMLLWLRNHFEDTINIVEIDKNLVEMYDSVLNLTSYKLYKFNNLVKEYQDFLSNNGEECKAYSVQEKWIQTMQEMGVYSKQEQVKLAACTANSLYLNGEYKRSLEVVKHALTVIENDSLILEYVILVMIKGKLAYKANNLTEAETALCLAMKNMISNNLTATLYDNYSDMCWTLFLLSNPEYIHLCYTNKFLDHIKILIKHVLFILLKAPLDRVPQETREHKMEDLPFEYFPPLSQQSSEKELVSEDKKHLFVLKHNIFRKFWSTAGYLLQSLRKLCMDAFELDGLRLIINFASILSRLILLRALIHVVRCFIWKSFRLFCVILDFIKLFSFYTYLLWIYKHL